MCYVCGIKMTVAKQAQNEASSHLGRLSYMAYECRCQTREEL